MTLMRALASRRLIQPAKSHLYASRRLYSTPPQPQYEPPTPAASENPHRAFYQSWGVPVAKVFLGALFTYQVLHYSWLKLEEMEVKQQKDEDIKLLEGRLADLTDAKKVET